MVQAAYPNSIHDQWAYLGRYQFDFGSGGGTQYVRLGNDVSHNQDEGNLIVADGVIFYPATIDPVGCPVEPGEGGLDPGWWVWDAVGVGSGQIEISWEYFGGGGDLDYLLIHRNTIPDFNTAQMVHSEEDTMNGSWVDSGVTDGVLYYYWLSPTYCYGDFETLGPESATTGITPTPRATPTNIPTPTSTATSTPTPVPLNTGWRNPTGNMASAGGDGDGFEVNAANAYTNNGLFAVDNNSGTLAVSGDVVCAGSHTDAHQFYNYGFTIPSGVTVVGIEVRLDTKVDSTTGSPKMCVQLSWDGGTTWTTGKLTPVLSVNETGYVLGSSVDGWGRSWSVANFSNASFRIRVVNVSSSLDRDFSLDWGGVKVYYQP